MRMRRTNKQNGALTLVEVVVAIVALAVIAALVLPLFVRTHQCGGPNCASNLKQIGLAFRVWEGDNNDQYPMKGFTNVPGITEPAGTTNVFRYFYAMSNELSNPMVLVCPADKRVAAASFPLLSNSNISYFVGLDADETFPAMPLAGDRNLVVNGADVRAGLVTLSPESRVGWSKTIHGGVGNICLADGSVQQVTSSGLQNLLANSGTNVNRLAVP